MGVGMVVNDADMDVDSVDSVEECGVGTGMGMGGVDGLGV